MGKNTQAVIGLAALVTMGLYFALYVAVACGVTYVLFHFIHKLW